MRQRVERLVIECRGVREFGTRERHARGCPRRVERTRAWANQRDGADLADPTRPTYLSGQCNGLRASVDRARQMAADAFDSEGLRALEHVHLSDDDLKKIRQAAPRAIVRSWAAARQIQAIWLAANAKPHRPPDGARLRRGGVAHAERMRRVKLRAEGTLPRLGASDLRLATIWCKSVSGGFMEARICERCGLELLTQKRGRTNRTSVEVRRHLRCANAARVSKVPASVVTRQLTWAVRHYLGGESHKAIAVRDYVTASAVTQGIAVAMMRLPEPAIADRRLALWILRLRTAEAKRARPA